MEVDATVQHKRAVEFDFHTGDASPGSVRPSPGLRRESPRDAISRAAARGAARRAQAEAKAAKLKAELEEQYGIARARDAVLLFQLSFELRCLGLGLGAPGRAARGRAADGVARRLAAQARRGAHGPRRRVTCVEIKFHGAFVLNRRVDLHAIDASPARWRGDVGSSPLDGASTAASLPRNDFVKNCRAHPTHS